MPGKKSEWPNKKSLPSRAAIALRSLFINLSQIETTGEREPASGRKGLKLENYEDSIA